MSRRSTHRIAAASVIATTAAVLSLTSCESGGALVGVGVAGGFCQQAANAQDWAVRHQQPTEFGVDPLKVVIGVPVHITGVRLVGGNGRLRLTNVAFVPAGPVGTGFRWSEAGTKASARPAQWDRRQEMPGAVLTALRPTRTQLQANPSADVWQVVVGVVPTAELGTAAGIKITYRAGRASGTVTGRQSIGLARTTAGCDQWEKDQP